MARTRKKYRAAPGAPFSQEKAPAVGQALENLKRSGPLTPERLVEAARNDPESVLHGLITWDDTEAAAKHRLHQARQIINHLVVEVVMLGEEQPAKVYFSVRQEEGRSYVSASDVARDENLMRQVCQRSMKELDYWLRQFGQYKVMFPLAEQVRAAMREFSERMEQAFAAHASGDDTARL